MSARQLIALVASVALGGSAIAAPAPRHAPQPASFDALYARASAAYRGARYDEAARLFRDLMALDPGDPALKFYLADSLSRIGRHEAARDRLLEFFVAVATDRTVPLSEYKPEVDAAPALMDRLVLVEPPPPAPPDDGATIFAGLALGAGAAAAGLLVGGLVAGARADQAQSGYARKWQDVCGETPPGENCLIPEDEAERLGNLDAEKKTQEGRETGLLLAAAGTAALSFAGLLTWLALQETDGPVLEVVPTSAVGRSAGAGLTLQGRF